jgi:hypothetical protein
MGLECGVGFRQLRTCRRTRPGQLCARLRHRDLLLKLSASLKVRKSSRRRDRVADPVHVGTDGCPDTLPVAFVGRARAQGSSRARATPSIYGRGRPRGSRHSPFRRMAIPEQQAQSDALKWFDVTGCDSGKRYRIRYGSAANVHEIDDAGRPIVGWCFVPSGHELRAASCLLKNCLGNETNEHAALSAAIRFLVDPRRADAHVPRRQAY